MSQLSALVDAQLDYHRQAVQILEELADKLKRRCVVASLPPPAVPVTTVRPLLASMGRAPNLPGQAQASVVPCLMLGCISEGFLELCTLIAVGPRREQSPM